MHDDAVQLLAVIAPSLTANCYPRSLCCVSCLRRCHNCESSESLCCACRSREHPHPIRVDAKMSAPVYIIRNDDGKQVAKKPWELATIRRAASVGSLGSLASASSLL